MGDSHRLESGILIFVWLLGAWVLCRHRMCWVGRWGPGTACSGSAPVRGGVHRSCGKALMKQGWQSGRELCSSNCFSLGSDTIHLEHSRDLGQELCRGRMAAPQGQSAGLPAAVYRPDGNLCRLSVAVLGGSRCSCPRL